MVLRDRSITKKVIKDNLAADGVEISTKTIQRRLVSEGLAVHRPRKKPMLTQKMRIARLNWAKTHQTFTLNDWNKVFYKFFTFLFIILS